MQITKTKSPVKTTKGREPKYPFRGLSPGLTLEIDVESDQDIQRVKSAFYQWRKYNKPQFETRTQVQGSKLLIHAI